MSTIFPKSPVSEAFDVVRARLTSDPVLSAAGGVRTWGFGTPDDAPAESSALPSSAEEYAVSQYPAILVHASCLASTGGEEYAQYVPLRLRFQMFLASDDVRDVFDLWYAVVRALFPRGKPANDVVNQLRRVGATGLRVTGTTPELGRSDDGESATAYGEAAIECEVYLPV
jgi:hypothetical protein